MTYLGVLQGAVFYPPVLLFALTSPPKAYSLYVMLHLVLGGFFLILFCRSLRITWYGSFGAAFAFLFCSNTVSNIFGPAYLANSIYLPLMLLFVLKIFQTGKAKWAGALAISVLLPLLAGWIQALVYCIYVMVFFAGAIVIRSFFRKSAEEHIGQGLLLLVGSAALFFLLSAIQVLPVAELSLQSTRSFEAISEEMLTINRTAMYGLFRIVYDAVNSKGALLPFYLYAGLFPLLLSLIALRHKELRFLVLFFFGAAGVALLLSMGTQTPLFKWVSYLPFMKMFRAPFRFLFLYAFSIAVLCGIGMDVLLGKMSSLGNQRVAAYIAVGAVVFCAILLAIWPTLAARNSPAATVLSAASRWPQYLLLFSLCFLFMIIFPVSVRTKEFTLGVVCISLILVDLFRANHNYFYLPEKNPEIYDIHDRAINTLKEYTALDNSRVFIGADFLDFSYCIKLGQLKKLPLVNDYENMNPLPYNRYCNYLFGKTDRRSREFFWGWFNLDEKLVHPELLDYMSAKYIWLNRSYLEGDNDTVRQNALSLTDPSKLIYADSQDLIFLNDRALPRAYIVGNARYGQTEDQLLELLTSEEFSPRKEVALLGIPPHADKNEAPHASPASHVVITTMAPEKIEMLASLDGAGFLVLTDQYYPGWKAFVDGKPVEIYRANYLFKGISLAAGKHKVVFRYVPMSFFIGAGLSSCGLLVILGWILISLHGRRRKREDRVGSPQHQLRLPQEVGRDAS